MTVRLTDHLLHSNTNCGAYTRAQLAVFGIDWPPAAGWKQSLIGREVSDDDFARFVVAKNELTRSTLRAHRKRQAIACEPIVKPEGRGGQGRFQSIDIENLTGRMDEFERRLDLLEKDVLFRLERLEKSLLDNDPPF